MQTKTDDKHMREYRRQMLRGEFRSLFWAMFSERKRKHKLTLQAFADRLGIGKSSLSRGFNEPQNWTIDKMADMADSLGFDLVVEARDRESQAVVTPSGTTEVSIKTVWDIRPVRRDIENRPVIISSSSNRPTLRPQMAA
jgi:transcriptional regulator with XRE-family HTH domain